MKKEHGHVASRVVTHGTMNTTADPTRLIAESAASGSLRSVVPVVETILTLVITTNVGPIAAGTVTSHALAKKVHKRTSGVQELGPRPPALGIRRGSPKATRVRCPPRRPYKPDTTKT